MEISENLKRLRKERGLTQKQLGQLCGMSEAMIRQYELGYRNPKFETLCKIANVLDMPVGYLVGSINIGIMTEDDVKAIEYFLQHPEANITDADENIETIKKMMYTLNDIGQFKAIEHVDLLTKIPEYRKDPDE